MYHSQWETQMCFCAWMQRPFKKTLNDVYSGLPQTWTAIPSYGPPSPGETRGECLASPRSFSPDVLSIGQSAGMRNLSLWDLKRNRSLAGCARSEVPWQQDEGSRCGTLRHQKRNDPPNVGRASSSIPNDRLL